MEGSTWLWREGGASGEWPTVQLILLLLEEEGRV